VGYILSMVEEIAGAVRFDQANVVQRGMRLLAGTRPMAWLFARVLHHLDGPVMRRNAGRPSVSAALTGLPIIELTTVGARSGESRTLPLVGVPDGDRLVLVASNYGKQQNPAWYYNLKANPRCSTAFRGQRHEMEAYEAEGEERQRLWVGAGCTTRSISLIGEVKYAPLRATPTREHLRPRSAELPHRPGGWGHS
jgi:deazaflavin-dependent oxidoreductase (nitroreductase family)